MGLLRVHVLRGVNLAVRDVVSSDPYVVIKMGKQVTFSLSPFSFCNHFCVFSSTSGFQACRTLNFLMMFYLSVYFQFAGVELLAGGCLVDFVLSWCFWLYGIHTNPKKMKKKTKTVPMIVEV